MFFFFISPQKPYLQYSIKTNIPLKQEPEQVDLGIPFNIIRYDISKLCAQFDAFITH